VILVTGATGRVGYPLLEALADTGAEFTAMVRVPAKGADLPGAAKYIVASFDDPPPAEVLQQFDRIFLLSPALEEQAELEIQFIDAVLTAGHRPHIVKMATDGFQDPGVEVRFARSHREVAVHLAATRALEVFDISNNFEPPQVRERIGKYQRVRRGSKQEQWLRAHWSTPAVTAAPTRQVRPWTPCKNVPTRLAINLT